MVPPSSNNPESVEELVRAAYTAIAERPTDKHPFPLGRPLALDLGYPAELLDRMPPATVDSFSGVTRAALLAEIRENERVLDLGCGAGLDTLIALSKGAWVVAVDFSMAMLSLTRNSAQELGLSQRLQVVQAQAHQIPLQASSMDLVLINGLFNLNPRRTQILQEVYRLLRPGGRVVMGEIVRQADAQVIPPEVGNWVA